jgi:DNA-binding GntR family transcriptional regulator
MLPGSTLISAHAAIKGEVVNASDRSRRKASDAVDQGKLDTSDSQEKPTGRFSGVGSSQLVSSIVKHLDDMMERGALVPGQRLVEADLAEELGVGRMPVREALRILAGDGVVQLSPNRGASIRRFEPRRLRDMLEVLTGLSIVVVRRLCSEELEPEVRHEVETAHLRIQAAIALNSPLEIMKSLINWHYILIIHSGNRYIADLWQRIHIQHYIYHVVDTVEPSAIHKVAAAYGKLTTALLNANWQQADRLLEQCWRVLADSMSNAIEVAENAPVLKPFRARSVKSSGKFN